MIINILILIFSIVYIWNYSGFIFDITKIIYIKLNPNKQYLGQQLPKPFSCYICMIFWTVLAICLPNMTLIYSLGTATLSTIIGVITDKLYGVFFKLINKIK